MLKIANLELSSRLILAPMSGVSDLPFRSLNRRFGCELAFSEMLNVRSLSYKSRKTQRLLSSGPEDKPLGVQLLGCEEKFILRALGVLKGYRFDLLDFNAACPAKKVTRRGEGSSLLKEPQRLNRLLRLIVRESAVPVTVKIRSGWDKTSVNACTVALAAEDAGIKGLFIHGRTKSEEYSDEVDYRTIYRVKKQLKVPVVASGNILSAALARRMFQETGCDGLLVARGALGNPWIFREIPHFLEKGAHLERPPVREVVSLMKTHLQSLRDFYSEALGVVIFRKFFAWYTKGWQNIRPLRELSSRARTEKEMLAVIEYCQQAEK